MLIVAWILGIYFVESLHGSLGNMFSKIIENDPNFLTIGNEGSKISAARYSSNIVVSMLGFVMWPHLFTKSYTTTAYSEMEKNDLPLPAERPIAKAIIKYKDIANNAICQAIILILYIFIYFNKNY